MTAHRLDLPNLIRPFSESRWNLGNAVINDGLDL